MKEDRRCQTCTHYQEVVREQWGKFPMPRCMRDRTLKSGEVLKHLDVGAGISDERASFMESHRMPGDKCGPDGRNWSPPNGHH
jgi:hypothetical protein